MAPNRKIYALKRIKLQGRDKEAAAGFIDEITLLQRLRGKMNIIQLLDAEVSWRLLRQNLNGTCCREAPDRGQA
jgi:serine/threonine protein kinase